MTACKMLPIWRRRMVGFGEFPFVSYGSGRGRRTLLLAVRRSLCISLPVHVAEVEKVIYVACVSYGKRVRSRLVHVTFRPASRVE